MDYANPDVGNRMDKSKASLDAKTKEYIDKKFEEMQKNILEEFQKMLSGKKNDSKEEIRI